MAEPGTHSWDNTLLKVSMHRNMLRWSKNISHSLSLKTSCACCEFCIEPGIGEHDLLPAFYGWLVTTVRNHFHKYLLRLDIILGTYCVQLYARYCGTKECKFSSLTVYCNRKFYTISLNPELCGLFCEGHRCSIGGEARVDQKVIANVSWELTRTKHSAEHYPTQFSHNFVKWLLFLFLFYTRESCGTERLSTSTMMVRGRPRRCVQVGGLEEPMPLIPRLRRGWLTKAAPPCPSILTLPLQPWAHTP